MDYITALPCGASISCIVWSRTSWANPMMVRLAGGIMKQKTLL